MEERGKQLLTLVKSGTVEEIFSLFLNWKNKKIEIESVCNKIYDFGTVCCSSVFACNK